MSQPERNPSSPAVALFVTCLVDVMRPSVGFAAVKLLEDAGCRVTVPSAQTCCGQPGYNAGEQKSARRIARQVIRAFGDYDYVVAPSGSCAGMIKKHYPVLFPDAADWRARAMALADRTWELTSFLAEVMKHDPGSVRSVRSVRFDETVSYHDSCSGLRELGIKEQPRKLLSAVEGAAIEEAGLAESCCGFGGLFCVKYPDISTSMADRKISEIEDGSASVVTGGDLGCLMNLAGRLSRQGSDLKVWHIAEILAGMTEQTAAICGVPDKADKKP